MRYKTYNTFKQTKHTKRKKRRLVHSNKQSIRKKEKEEEKGGWQDEDRA